MRKAFAVTVFVWSLGACAMPPPNLPLPEGTRVVAPGTEVPAPFADFSGTWGGYWDGRMASMLVVERISATGDAQGVYLWGAVPEWNARAGSTKFTAKIADGTLSWVAPDRTTKFEFSRTQDGTLRGRRYIGSAPQGAVVMTKAP